MASDGFHEPPVCSCEHFSRVAMPNIVVINHMQLFKELK